MNLCGRHNFIQSLLCKAGFTIGLLLCFTQPAVANLLEPVFLSAADYQGGEALCKETSQDTSQGPSVQEDEGGSFLDVPVDYANPASGQTRIYFHYSNGFDPAKPSLVFFNGGPGESSHAGLLSFDFSFNIILFDQRGIACSRPPAYSSYQDPTFYSSENSALDAEQIRLHLKINKWSVYGVSYGSVPATIYANKFSSATRALVLEGSVFSGEDNLWTAPHRRKILQRLIKHLPEEAQAHLQMFGKLHALPPEWFSLLARAYLTGEGGVEKLRQVLLHLDGSTGDDLAARIRQNLEAGSKTSPGMSLYESDSLVYGMLSCLELGLLNPAASPLDHLDGLRLVPVNNTLATSYCQVLGITSASIFFAERYPLMVPVTYFQGGDDGATESPMAILHYKKVAQGPSQLLISPRGGHNPNLDMIYGGSVLQQVVFETALRGEKIPQALLQQLKDKENHFWAYTSK